MKREIRRGDKIWRGYRYWRNIGETGFPGWNTAFIPYRVIAVTSKRIEIGHIADTICGKPKTVKDWKPLFLNRETIERDGKQYHTRFHEYFFSERPVRDPEQEFRVSGTKIVPTIPLLNLSGGYTREDAKQAYRRAARKMHPDGGGSHEAFLKLTRAYQEALRLAR